MKTLQIMAAQQMLSFLLENIPNELGQEVIDGFLDSVENKVASTSTKWDDIILLPVVRKARVMLNVPDNDDEDVTNESENGKDNENVGGIG